jgi:molybdenum cofactor cytidylyltransferase
MGRPKALLPWSDTTLLGHALRELRAADAAVVVVVLGAEADKVAEQLPDEPWLRAVVNREFENGRSSSVRAGAHALAGWRGPTVVQSVDQPCGREVIEALYAALERSAADLALPVHAGRRGHPLCVAARLMAELAAVQETDQGLRAVVRRHRATSIEVPVDSAAIHLNLNDPAAYTLAYDARIWT